MLSIGETVEEVTDSGFLGTTPTLSCTLLGENALVQVRWSNEMLTARLEMQRKFCGKTDLQKTVFSFKVGNKLATSRFLRRFGVLNYCCKALATQLFAGVMA